MLHTVNQSPYSSTALESCIRLTTSGDEILLLENGVYAVSHPLLENCPCAVYALGADLNARGLTTIAARLTIIDYARFVELVVAHNKQVAW